MSDINGQNEAATNVEDALQLVGGFGLFQWIVVLVNCGNYLRSAYTYYAVPYMIQYPEYLCTSPGSTEQYECYPYDEPAFCDNPDVTYEVNYDSNVSLHNWIQTLDLNCTPAG